MTTDLHPGYAFGAYVLERRLGGGGFGEVWLARNNAGGRVAIKVLVGAYQSNEAAKLRAEIELLAAAASSRSTHIVRVLGGGSEPVPFVVMEYIEGVDVAQEIDRRGSLPVEEVLNIADGIANALGTLQEAGIIHRDIKPANVMIDGHGVVKLTDFGIAKIVGLDTITATNQTQMSMAYAAPEVWEGKASHLSDHYAFGVLLYQCLTGRPPFNGGYVQIYNHHRDTVPDLKALPDDTPAALSNLIGACLAKEQTQRPQAADTLIKAVRAAREEMAVDAEKTVFISRNVEPKALGPWLIDAPSPARDWTFQCHHESTSEQALVELHFSSDLEYGQSLRRAVAASVTLAPLGGERLINTSRLVLRPGERWRNSPEATFLFWLARRGDPDDLPEQQPEITTAELRRVTSALQDFIDVATAQGLKLDLRPGNIVLKPGASLYVRRPGLGPFPETDQLNEAMAFLSAITLKPEEAKREQPPAVEPPVVSSIRAANERPISAPDAGLTAVFASSTLPGAEAEPAMASALIASSVSGSMETDAKPPLVAKPAAGGSAQRLGIAFGALALVAIIAVVALVAVPKVFGSNGGDKKAPNASAASESATHVSTVDISTLLTRADSSLAAKNYDSAVTDYTKALSFAPKSDRALFGRGNAYKGLNKNDQALADYSKAIDLNPSDVRYLVARGDVYRAQKKTDLAWNDYTRAITLDPKNFNAYLGRAALSDDAKSYDASIADYTKMIEVSPRSAYAFTYRGVAYKNQNKSDLALADYNKAIEIDARYSTAYYNRGELYRSQGKTDPAWVDYSKAIELSPMYSSPYFGRGSLSLNAKYYDGAISDYSKVIELVPNEPGAYNNRGLAHEALKQYDAAIADYTKAIQLDGTAFNPWRNRGIAYQGQGKKDLARQDYEKAKSLAKTPDEMQRAQASLDSLK